MGNVPGRNYRNRVSKKEEGVGGPAGGGYARGSRNEESLCKEIIGGDGREEVTRGQKKDCYLTQ